MQFNIDQSVICSALSKISYALENKDELEAYTHMAFRMHDGLVRITGSNRFMNTEATLAVNGEYPNVSFGFPGQLFYKYLKTLPQELLNFCIEGVFLKVTSSRSSINLPIIAPERFHDFFPDRMDYNTSRINYVEINMVELVEGLKKVSHCLIDDNVNRSIAGLLINAEHFVTTDGYRMAIYPNNAIMLPDYCSILIPAMVAPRLWKVYHNIIHSGVGQFSLTETQVHIRHSGIACAFNLKNGKFPSYQGILPKEAGIEINFSRQSALDSFKRASLMKKESSGDIIVEIRDGYIFVKSESDLGKVNESIPCDHLKYHCFGLNARFMVDALMQSSCEDIKMSLHYNKNELSTIVIQDGGYRNVIKPIRVYK